MPSDASFVLLLRPTACGLVAVGIAQERAVVGGMIVAQAGWPIIHAASGDAGAPERVYLVSRVCLEAPVTAGGFVRFRAPQERVEAFARAENFINGAEAAGGVFAPLSRSFTNQPRVGSARVDIEVITGRALVPTASGR